MATIVLSAVGAALGGSVGGAVLGLSAAAIGRAAGATLGRVIDQKLMGGGSEAVETGRIERFRLTGASEGAPVASLHGRVRVAGQVIWSSRFQERKSTSGGGKGGRPQPATTQYSYSVSMAVALCEGEIAGVGRVWADGVEVAVDDISLRVYRGGMDQMPDPKIQAVEGTQSVPAYRGTAYVVFEDLDLSQFGNRVPQFTFEVMRMDTEGMDLPHPDLSSAVRAVALIPGTGEYALATTPVHFEVEAGNNASANVNTPSGRTDFLTSMDALDRELPNCGSIVLVVSWFGDDLRCGQCTLKPKVDQKQVDGVGMPWQVSGVDRAQADRVALLNGEPVYGGCPSDASVIEAIRELTARGQDTVFYPFILMEQLADNSLPDPWSDAASQPPLPWRGRITLDKAPGQNGTSDGTAQADADVASFFGQASLSDFVIDADTVVYSGPEEWSFRRFVLHYAYLCQAAGGVSAFCIGSEMRALTQIRGASGFPSVEALRVLANEVRAVLGPQTKIGYAADWSEYFGYTPQDSAGDHFFHLDPLWADDAIDFIGIDNYMPLSDWRDGDDHRDAGWGSIYDLKYLQSNIEGGEGFDWYYHSPEASEAQIRTPIEDGAHDEPWIYRYKDIRNWWSNAHHNRTGGARDPDPTAWTPMSKPVWFTEIGCAAVDRGTNEPNRFLDVKSSESGLPKYSKGLRDDLIQMQYIRALTSYWDDPQNNPVSPVYEGRMIDCARTHVWAWDARPYPFFPARSALWSDGSNYARGHWITGRATSRPLSEVVRDICARSGIDDPDVSGLHGYVRGYTVSDVSTARAALQPLMLVYGFDAIERSGRLVFRSRNGRSAARLELDQLAFTDEQDSTLDVSRSSAAEVAGRVRLNFIEADADYETRAAEAVFPGERTHGVAQSEAPLVLTQAEGKRTTERWLAEARVARDSFKFALPPSDILIGAGDIIELATQAGIKRVRIDHVEDVGPRIVEAVAVDKHAYEPSNAVDDVVSARQFVPALPVFTTFLDLPLMSGDEVPHAPHIAVTAALWPGQIAVYSASSDEGYGFLQSINTASYVGITQNDLVAANPETIDMGAPLKVRLTNGTLESVDRARLLAGANLAAIGDGTSDGWELFQFETADLVDEQTYELSGRLRGQAGTDGVMPPLWPAGSLFVLIDTLEAQIDLAASYRNVARHYRVGPASKGLDDPSFTHHIAAFKGVGLRPYAPSHLRAERTGSGDVTARWIRRTRIDGDIWDGLDVPLGEDTETYLVRIVQSGEVLREAQVPEPQWQYSLGDQTSDGAQAPFAIEVAQVSARFGAGPFKRIVIHD